MHQMQPLSLPPPDFFDLWEMQEEQKKKKPLETVCHCYRSTSKRVSFRFLSSNPTIVCVPGTAPPCHLVGGGGVGSTGKELGQTRGVLPSVLHRHLVAVKPALAAGCRTGKTHAASVDARVAFPTVTGVVQDRYYLPMKVNLLDRKLDPRSPRPAHKLVLVRKLVVWRGRGQQRRR